MTSKISAKFLEIFRNIKSDAVPRPPRPDPNDNRPSNHNNETEEQSHNVDYSYPEEVFVGPGSSDKKYKKKSRKSSSTSYKETTEVPEEEEGSSASSNVNTQATGNVINIVNSNNVRWGNEFVYYMGPVSGPVRQPSRNVDDGDDDEEIEKTDTIQLLLESSNKAELEYLDYISKNLGKNWHRFFRKLGYKQGQIETAEIDTAKIGVAEARYKLLLDWIRNDDDGTIGRLSTVLWECGERQIVKELAAIFSLN